jgi:hypothetical protein
MKRFILCVCLAVLVSTSALAFAADGELEAFLPQSCVAGWVMEGRPVSYNPENLYKYIDGEAELYLPYGFEKVAAVLYSRPTNKGAGIVVNVFKMGSLLDAFGIYGNYRTPTSEWAKVGVEGFVEETELLFYRDRYFVQMMASGTAALESSLLLACGSAIDRAMPVGTGVPPELALLGASSLVPHSEKYFPEGLLGYKFLGKGLTGEAATKNAPVKVFIVLGDSPQAARDAVESYARQAREAKNTSLTVQGTDSLRLTGIDPLYKGIFMQQSGRYVVGVTGFAEPGNEEGLVTQLLQRLPH